MKDLRIKLKRQTEMIGLVLSNPYYYKMADFELLFNIQSSTIKRDLQEIRSWGIDIHSSGKRGLIIDGKIPIDIVKELLPQYMGIAVTKSSHDAAINLMVKKLRDKSIEFIVLLQLAIEMSNKVRISYQKDNERNVEVRELEPYCLFQSDKAWRLLANHNGKTKQFLISRIKSVDKLDKKFKQISKVQLQEIFQTSFKSWLGDSRFNVKIKLLSPWAERLLNRQLMEVQEIINNEDGSVIFENTGNSLNEIASWVVSRGKGVIVLEPESLKKEVLDIANGVISNYK